MERDSADPAPGGRDRQPAAARGGLGAPGAPAPRISLAAGDVGAACSAGVFRRRRGRADRSQLSDPDDLRRTRASLRRQAAAVSQDCLRVVRELRLRAQRRRVVSQRHSDAPPPLYGMGSVTTRRGGRGGAERRHVLARHTRATGSLVPRCLFDPGDRAACPAVAALNRRCLPDRRGRVPAGMRARASPARLATLAVSAAFGAARADTGLLVIRRLGARRRGALRASPATPTGVQRFRRRFCRGAGGGCRESRAGRPRGLRADPARVLPGIGGWLGAARLAARVSGRLLSPAVADRGRVAGCPRGAQTEDRGCARGDPPRPLVAGAPGAGGDLLPFRYRPARIRGYAGCDRTARGPRSNAPAGGRRAIALRR